MWFAGLFGVIFMTGNILLLPRLGSLQTVLMPVLGQITMGLLIDQFGWLGNPRHPMTMARAAGLVLAVLGVLLAVAAADAKTLFGGPNPFGSRHGAAHPPRNAVRGHVATPCGRPLHEPNPLAKHLAMAWTGHTLRHVVGGASRHAGTTGYGARIADQASVVSFILGFVLLCAVVVFRDHGLDLGKAIRGHNPPWMWIGGLLGAVVVLMTSCCRRNSAPG